MASNNTADNIKAVCGIVTIIGGAVFTVYKLTEKMVNRSLKNARNERIKENKFQMKLKRLQAKSQKNDVKNV